MYLPSAGVTVSVTAVVNEPEGNSYKSTEKNELPGFSTVNEYVT